MLLQIPQLQGARQDGWQAGPLPVMLACGSGSPEIAELKAACAEKAALLAAAEERLARLEALHSIAKVCLTARAPYQHPGEVP